jgi:phage gp36-like protein
MGYASLSDMANFGFPPSAFGQLSTVQIQAQLDSASAYANSKMAARYGMPLLPPFDVSIVQAVVQIAAYQCLVLRGFDPQNPGDSAARDLWIAAREFFDAVERQHAHPLVNESAQTNQAQPSYAAPMVSSRPLEGWLPDSSGASSTPGPSGIN